MSCSLPYIQLAAISESEKIKLDTIHNQILDEAEESKAFDKENGELRTMKNKYPEATAFIGKMVEKYAPGVARLISIGNGRAVLNINVLPLTSPQERDLEYFNGEEALYTQDSNDLNSPETIAEFKEFVGKQNTQNILLQKKEKQLVQIKASSETIEKVKELAKKMGVDIQSLADYAKKTGLDTTDVNGVADLMRGIIAVAQGKEGEALTEEMVHIATAILEQINPKIVTELISKIDRFKIYQQTLKEYRDNKQYQLPDGKPDIRKIKKEAVDKLIAELIIKDLENIEQYPELRDEVNLSLIRKMWNAILDFFNSSYKSANIDIFNEAASLIQQGKIGGTIKDIQAEGVYFQVSDKQAEFQKKIKETDDSIRKKEGVDTKVHPSLLDSEEANNFYEIQKPDGTWEKILNRVTDRVKSYYKKKFGDPKFTPEQQKVNNKLRDYGIQGHLDLQEIHNRFYNEDGTKRETPLPKPTKFNLPSKEMFDKLGKYYAELINSLDKDTLVFAELVVYDKKEKEAGTIDFLAIDKTGKTTIFDWKFMNVKGDDIPIYKQGGFNIQLGRYKDILRENYGIKEFDKIRAIPIIMEFKPVTNKKDAEINLSGILIGSVDSTKIEDIRLIPVSEESESTGNENLDKIIAKMNSLFKKVEKEKVKTTEDYEFKRERIDILKSAIREAQGRQNLTPFIKTIEVLRKEGDRLLEEYNFIYKNKAASANDIKDSELSDFSTDLNEYLKVASEFVNIDKEMEELIYSKELLQNAKTKAEIENVNKRKEILNNLRDETASIFKSHEELKGVALKFADKFIGERNFVVGLSKPQAVVKGLASSFRDNSELPLKSIEALTKLTRSAQNKAASAAFNKVEKLAEIRKKLSSKTTDLRKYVQQIYQKDDKGSFVNKLIYRYSDEFHKEVNEKAAKGGDKKWLSENIDIEGYKKEAKKKMDILIEYIDKNTYSGTEEEAEITREIQKKKVRQEWDIARPDFTGFDNYIVKRHPLPKWYSKEYENALKDPDLLELYDFIVAFNEEATDVGFIQNQVMKTFLPFVSKGMAEKLVWDGKLSVMDSFYKTLEARPESVGYGQIDEFTGEVTHTIPKYYTYDFSRKEDNTHDYSEVSEDLFKNMILYIQQVEKYKYLTEVEGQLKLVKTIEEFKGHLETDAYSNVILDSNGKPKVSPKNESNTKLFDDFLKVLVYGQKYVLSDSDTPLHLDKVLNGVKKAINSIAGKEVWKESEESTTLSLVKTIDAVNKGFQLKTLGFEFISGAVNAFGANIQLATQAGNYFKAREFAKNEAKLMGQSFKNKEEKELFAQLINTFMPLKDDPSYEIFKEAGMSKLTQGSLSDTLFVFMRKPEQLIEKAVFLTLLENTMVENGKIVSIKEYVKNKYKNRYSSAAEYNKVKDEIKKEEELLKNEKSLSKTVKLENGQLVIPGLDLNNKKEVERLTNLSRTISGNATGNMTKASVNRMSMSIWTNSMMVFKRWIPKLVDTRFSEFRKVSDDFSSRVTEKNGEIVVEGQKYDIGRIRLLGYVLTFNIFKGVQNIKNILYLNDKGLLELDQMFEDFRNNYEKRTGETLEMDRDQFIDLIRTNLRNQIKELAILATLFSMMLSMGFIAPDDDEDKATKNRMRYAQRVLDKFVSELLFFYNPAEIEHILSGGIFPAIGIFNDFFKFTSNFFKEITGLDFDPSTSFDDVRKKAQPIKYGMKMLPITKSLVTYLAIIDEDFAKEFEVTVPRKNR